MNRATPFLGLALLVVAAAAAADPPPATPPQVAPPASQVLPESRIVVRVYEGFNTLGPLYGTRDPAFATDVGVNMATCPDGNTAISSLDVGGWNYQVATPCTGPARQGQVRVNAGSARSGAGAPRSPHVIRCDPSTWRCAPAP